MAMYEATVQVQLTVRVEAEESGQANDLVNEFVETGIVDAAKASPSPVDVTPDVWDIVDLHEM